MKGWLSILAVVVAGLSLHGERQSFDRYQSIVDRQMFGQPPEGFDPTKPPSEVSAKEERAKEQELTKEQEQLKSAIHFSMVNVTPSGETAVGFTDNSNTKEPKHYYLKVGETRDGWTVKEADALKATMTIAKGEIEVDLTLGGNSASGAGVTRRAGEPTGGNGGARPGAPAMGARPNLLGGRGPGGGGFGSLRERRMQREAARAAEAKAAAEAKEKADAEAKAKEQQREAERAAEKAERDREREEQRAQLQKIQEELKRAREEKARAEAEARAKEEAKATTEGQGEK